MEIKLSNLYWVIHTIQTRYSNGLVDTIHTKQVMRETWQDGKITEEPLSDKYIITGEEFKKAMDAYNWNEMLGEPSDYIKKGVENE